MKSLLSSKFSSVFLNKYSLWLIVMFSFTYIILLYSCRKDYELSNEQFQHPKLTIERAKKILEQTEIKIIDAQNRDEEEEGIDIGVYLRLGLNNGVEYYHEGLGLEVVEIPILESNLSRTYHIGASINNVDQVNINSLNGHVAKVLITQQANDSNVNIVILKLSATLDYLLTNDITSNSFGSMDNDFEGLVEYCDLRDSMLKSYLVSNGLSYEVDSITYLNPAVVDSISQNPVVYDRWGYCIIGWFTARPCTGNQSHNCEERGRCPCIGEDNGSCNPPVCIPIMEFCGLPPFANPQGTSHGNPGLPNPPSNPFWTGGGSGGGNPNPTGYGCLGAQNALFNIKYGKFGINLLDDYEDIAHECFLQNPGCSNEQFEVCAFSRILDEIIEEVPLQQPVPPISSTKLMCSNFFNFRPLNYPNDAYQHAGIEGLVLRLQLNTGPRNYYLRFVHFRAYETQDCNLNNIAAAAINATVTSAAVRINQGNLVVGDPAWTIAQREMYTILTELDRNFRNLILSSGCSPQGVGASPNVTYPSYGPVSDLRGYQGIIFNNFGDILNFCP